MTERIGSLSTATRKAVIDHDSTARDRLGEIRQQDNVFAAFGRRGQVIGSFDSADAAIAAVRAAALPRG